MTEKVYAYYFNHFILYQPVQLLHANNAYMPRDQASLFRVASHFVIIANCHRRDISILSPSFAYSASVQFT